MTKKLKLLTMLVASAALLWPIAKAASAHGSEITVEPQVFDPFHTHLVAAEWEPGIGCPTNGTIVPFAPPSFPPQPYTDPACTTGDTNDERNEGLLLVKTGPTSNDAAAGAVLHGVKGITLHELGYDIRKPGPAVPPGTALTDPRGSHCGAGAPRFNITIAGFIYFLGCNSPAPDTDTAGNGWQRLRWGTTKDLSAAPQCSGGICGVGHDNPCVGPASPTYCDIKGLMVDSIEIVFDEGDDTGPDNFGAAVLDNIDVNGILVGRGPEEHANKDDESKGKKGEEH
jgi:hypothetical protein